MPLHDPVAIFTASSNARAQALCHVLNQSGVEAHVTEDLSLAGLWMGGTLPGVHSPKVWVDRADADRAAEILRQHERREAELRPGHPGEIEVTCEDCGHAAAFPAAQAGNVQECPHCGAYVDVAGGEDEGWGEAEGGGPE